ncbi:MAG: hypothetical protein ACKV0T_08590 [Planctomycetales bacterium]
MVFAEREFGANVFQAGWRSSIGQIRWQTSIGGQYMCERLEPQSSSHEGLLVQSLAAQLDDAIACLQFFAEEAVGEVLHTIPSLLNLSHKCQQIVDQFHFGVAGIVRVVSIPEHTPVRTLLAAVEKILSELARAVNHALGVRLSRIQESPLHGDDCKKRIDRAAAVAGDTLGLLRGKRQLADELQIEVGT